MFVCQTKKIAVKEAASRKQSKRAIFNLEAEPLRVYLQEIRKYPLLTLAEEQFLGEQISKGRDPGADEKTQQESRAAQQKLINSNLRLVIKIVREYDVSRSARFWDLIQEGNIGLIYAVKKYDYAKSKFSTYAAHWIRSKIMRALKNSSMIYLPNRKIGAIKRLGKDLEFLQQEYGREPTAQELAEYTGLSLLEIAELRKIDQQSMPWSLSVDRNGDSLNDFIRDPSASDWDELNVKSLLRHAVKQGVLSAREADIVYKRNIEKFKLKELNVIYRVTKEWVRQIDISALKKLKVFLEQ
ncbi:MAG: sigma-70 family RNA polymerase sigma factor [Candidatus Margulisbacteria bacterium]|jgi:RNA polymerase primary sigma factor|nr:sigma-70 family RNA polymerase sigma factor [Candidatus Margulisiibacteriota bacterium]